MTSREGILEGQIVELKIMYPKMEIQYVPKGKYSTLPPLIFSLFYFPLQKILL